MKVGAAKNIGSISVLALLFASTFVIIVNNSYADSSSISADNTSSEVSAASGSNRFVVWSDNTPGNYEIFLRRSPDNGATWQAIKNLSNNPGHSYSPEIAVSGSNVYVVWLQLNADGTREDIFFRRSTDNGATWKSIVKITSIGTIGFSTPQVTNSGSNIFVVWEQENGEIYIRRSNDNGVTWKSIFNISNNPGFSAGEQIAVSGSNVYIVWYQENADSTQSDVFFRRSADNGATWKSKVNLSNFGDVRSIPQMAVSGSNIHVVWNQRDPTSDFGYLQVFIRSSSNNGATWNSAENVKASTTDLVDPQVGASGSNVYLLYAKIVEDQEKTVIYDIVFVASSNNGDTWESEFTVAEATNHNTNPEPQILALGSNVYAIWHDGSQSEGNMYFRGSTDNGDSWGPISRDLSSNQRRIPLGTQIAASGSSVYIVWGINYPSEVYFVRSVDKGMDWERVKNLSNSDSGISHSPQIAV